MTLSCSVYASYKKEGIDKQRARFEGWMELSLQYVCVCVCVVCRTFLGGGTGTGGR